MNTFVDVISENAERNPNKTTLVDEYGSYTYQELDRLSNGVAAKLIGQGIGAGDIVPILMTRSKAFVAAFIGVMKSGAAFVPLDINYPEERIKSIEESVEARIFIDDEWMKEVAPSDEFINNSKPEDMAFIIFTSGSTGKPKGVVHTHKSAAAMARVHSLYFESFDIHNLGSFMPFNFVGGLHDCLTSLLSCYKLYIISDDGKKEISKVINWISENKIDYLKVTPSYFNTLLCNRVELRYAELVGERLQKYDETDIRVMSGYGCSEFVPAVCNNQVSNDSDVLGTPPPYTKAFIVNEYGEAVKGESNVGELCLVGPQMASGYWKMPELTAEKFVHCPFLPGDVKMYKTGDLARYREDGNIELVGRKDFQIKIRGFRIEPGEIENVAVKFDGIDTVVVVAKEMGAEKQLVLYYTSNEQVDEPKLKEYLSRYLAYYMVPNFYVRLDEMPRNVNGKIDRSVLPEPKIIGGGENSDKPLTELEKIIFDFVAKQIGTADYGIDDNFVNLGLTSIGSMYLISNLCKIGYTVELNALIKNVTVRSLARHIEKVSVSYKDTKRIERESNQNNLAKNENKRSSSNSSKIKNVYRVLRCLAAITKLHPIPVFQFLKLNNFSDIVKGNALIPSRFCILEIDKSATIDKKGISVLGSRFHFAKSHLETRLMLRGNSCLNLCNTRIGYGADIEVFENSSLSFGNNTSSNIGLTIICQDRITIGKNVGIGRDVTIRDNNGGHFVDLPNYRNATPVEIGDGSWLCSKCTIMSGVTVGEGAVIGANSFVTHNIPAHSLASGHPAEILANDISFKS